MKASIAKRTRWPGSLLPIGLLAMAIAGDALAGEADELRHPRRFSPARKPAGVPSDFVLTRSGFMHPSCVITVSSDEMTGRDGEDTVIRGPDGAERMRVPPCAYPRYRRNGQMVAAVSATGAASSAAHTTPHAGQAAYDGWIVSYQSDGTFDPGSTLVTDWYVPALPTKVGGQDIAFFNDILTTAGTGGDILQPVLDFSEMPGEWAIESEHCCINGNDYQSTLVPVSPGDLIRGTVAPSSCNTVGLCTKWTITTLDVTTGKSTVNNATESSGKAYAINSAALESYGITSCDMFPANGEATFFNNVLTSPGGTVAKLTDSLQVITSRESGSTLPLDCGYAGKATGNSYTLIYAKTHQPIVAADAGAGGANGSGGSDGGARDATASGGAPGSGGHTGSGGSTGTGGRTGSGGQTGSGGSTGTGGSTGSGGDSGSGGRTGGSGGATSSGGSSGKGGNLGSGGVAGTGGSIGAGGSTALGGESGSGGVSATAGSTATGGTVGSNGSGGSAGSGNTAGSSGAGGLAASGGESGNGGRGGSYAHVDAGSTPTASSSGCSCGVTVAGSRGFELVMVALSVAMALCRRRRTCK